MPRPIPVLHSLFQADRGTTFNHAYCFPRYASQNTYVYHHALAPVTEALRNIRFDAVILTYDFLSVRSTRYFPEIWKKFSFLATLPVPKLAIPQDEYTGSGIFEKWMQDIDVTRVYVVTHENVDIIYPALTSQGKVAGIGTGYVDAGDVATAERFARRFNERRIDIGTRVRRLPAQFGSFGQFKSEFAVKAGNAFANQGFAVDVSVRDEDVLLGRRWLEFLGDCRFSLGWLSGSSINDPYNLVRDAAVSYERAHPGADYDEIKAACFPNVEEVRFPATSPRMIEAAAFRTCQILADDVYPNGVRPWVHYIPLRPDLGNLTDVVGAMRNHDLVLDVIDSAYRHFITSNNYSYERFVMTILGDVETFGGPPADRHAETMHLIRQHFTELQEFAAARAQNILAFLLQQGVAQLGRDGIAKLLTVLRSLVGVYSGADEERESLLVPSRRNYAADQCRAAALLLLDLGRRDRLVRLIEEAEAGNIEPASLAPPPLAFQVDANMWGGCALFRDGKPVIRLGVEV